MAAICTSARSRMICSDRMGWRLAYWTGVQAVGAGEAREDMAAWYKHRIHLPVVTDFTFVDFLFLALRFLFLCIWRWCEVFAEPKDEIMEATSWFLET